MAVKSNTGNPDPIIHTPAATTCDDVKKVFVEFEKTLVLEQESSENAIIALEAVQTGKRNDVCAERRSYNKNKKVLDFYTATLNCQAISLCADIEQTQETVKRKTTLAGDIKKGFDGVLNGLRTLKEKMKTVHQLSCQTDTAVNDSSNTTTQGLINEALGKLQPPRKIGGKDNYDQFAKQAIEGINAVDQAFETAVNVAGIYAYANLAAVKLHTDNLKAQCDLFKGDAENNIKTLEADLKNAQKSLADALAKMSVAEADYARSQTVDDAVRETLEKVRKHIPPELGDFVPVLLQQSGPPTDPVDNVIDKKIQGILKAS